MKLFITSCLAAAACLLALPSFAFLPDAPSAATSAAGLRASLKLQSISTTVTVTINEEGERTETTVTKLNCAGPAYDCRVNSAGETVYVAPIGV